MSGAIAITGVPTTPGSGGAVPLRRELRDLQKNFPDQFNLLVLGLKSLEGQDEAQLTSYYQIAGIHGMPFKPWDGVDSNTDWQSTSGFGGYCTHSSILFLTWHRPYLALYEQCLYKAVQDVAAKFPAGALRNKYVAAAQGFRAPYFDWASQPPQGTSAFPSALSSPKIQVVDVDGQTKSIANPLYHFSFHPVNPSPADFTKQWSRYPTTVRYPNQAGTSQDWRVGPVLANELASLRSNVGLLLLSYNNYDAFSFNRWDPNTSPGEFGSLEDVHNEIHDRTGGGGHMSALEVSAFDPLFWMHHINVDRLYAIWQDLNPDSFMSARPAPYSTFNAEVGEPQSQDTPLKPFWDKSGRDFWTSAQIKDTSTFGYAYPETQKWQFPDQETYQAALRQAVAGLYGTNVFSNFVANVAQRRTEHAVAATAMAAQAKKPEGHAAPPEHSAPPAHETPRAAPPAPAPAPAAQNFLAAAVVTSGQPGAHGTKKEKEGGPIPATLRHLAPNRTYTEWILNARAQKHGLGQTFRLLVFLGPFDESDPGSWDTEFNCVGRVSVLGRSADTTQCAKCRKDGAAELMVSGTVPLTSALLQDIVEGDGGLASLRPEDVVPHLRERLKWKATLFDGSEKHPEEVPGLKVSVASTEVTIGEDGLPVYSGEYTVWHEATEGKPAGLRQGEHV